MSDSSKQPPVSNKVIEVLVDSVFKKNGVNPGEVKKNISDEQKQMLKEMVEDLKSQVEAFNQNNNKKRTENN